jgi:hypothetical protein
LFGARTAYGVTKLLALDGITGSPSPEAMESPMERITKSPAGEMVAVEVSLWCGPLPKGMIGIVIVTPKIVIVVVCAGGSSYSTVIVYTPGSS